MCVCGTNLENIFIFRLKMKSRQVPKSLMEVRVGQNVSGTTLVIDSCFCSEN